MSVFDSKSQEATSAFAIYRLPHADHCVRIEQTSGAPAELLSCRELNGQQGFVIVPFEISPEQPICIIRPDRVENVPIPLLRPPLTPPTLGGEKVTTVGADVSPTPAYASDFSTFHARLVSGTFRKIVLARCAEERKPEPLAPLALFERACALYPRLFISLVYTPRTGYWLTATPEILLERDTSRWRTIALAGTMRLDDSLLDSEGETLTWSTKNIQEQRYVATYISDCLERFASDIQEEGPRTVRAANLVHLRSDFTFSLSDADHLGDLLASLHPTPAVCGLPKREAFDFIVRHEHTPRRYYSGFMGPMNLSLSPDDPHTHLYVSLRCMHIDRSVCHLYAGGGLLKDSQLEQEWLETEAKLDTMRTLLFSP